jgi:LmbE family N-acetylglucosaminyl deacetylase
MRERVLVVSPHPDDESVGCGGTLRRHVVAGDVVEVLFLTSGEGGGHGRSPEETRRVRESEARRAARALGVGRAEFWRLPDGGLRATEALVRRLAEHLRARRTTLVYVPHEGEAHADHAAAARLVRRALASLGRRAPRALAFEVWTPLPRMDVVVDVTPHWKAKRAAMRAHASQCGVLRFDEAFEGLARYRGEMFCWPKDGPRSGRYAEVFVALPARRGR